MQYVYSAHASLSHWRALLSTGFCIAISKYNSLDIGIGTWRHSRIDSVKEFPLSDWCRFLIAFFFNAKKRQVKKKIELRQNASAHADLKILQVPASFHWCDFMLLRHSAFKIKRQVSCYWKWLTLFLPIGQKNDSRKIVHLNWQKMLSADRAWQNIEHCLLVCFQITLSVRFVGY